MPKLRVFSGAELCNFLSEHGFERVRSAAVTSSCVEAKFLFRFRCIASSTAEPYAAIIRQSGLPRSLFE